MSSLLLPQLLASAGRRSAPTAVAGPSAAVLRRAFGASAPRPSFHFDTQTFIERLEREGLSRQQATGVMGALAEVRSFPSAVDAVAASPSCLLPAQARARLGLTPSLARSSCRSSTRASPT